MLLSFLISWYAGQKCMLESVAVVEDAADITCPRLVFITAAHNGGIIDDGRLETVRCGTDDGIGSVAVIPWLREAAGVDQVDAVFLRDQCFMSMAKENCFAIFLHRFVIQIVQTVVNVLHMTMGQQDPSIVGLDDLEVVCTVAAVAIALDCYDRNSEFSFQCTPVLQVISCMCNKIQIGQFREDFPYFIQLSMCVTDY